MNEIIDVSTSKTYTFFSCSNEPLGSIKFGEFLDWPRTRKLLKKDPAAWTYRFYLLAHHVHIISTL
jgi:hypothetical protein